jgi:hypothetical protein
LQADPFPNIVAASRWSLDHDTTSTEPRLYLARFVFIIGINAIIAEWGA